MDLSIIIVSFNTKKLLQECLKSLGTEGEVMVVDNASKDGSAEMVEENFPKVNLIRNKKNLGFAQAANQALRKVQAENILFLNSDTRVKPNSLQKLIRFAQKQPQLGAVGARLINPNGSIQPSVYHFPTLARAIREYWLGQKGVYEKYAPKVKEPIEDEAVTGAAMLVPRKTIEKIGFLNEKYFMYFEDLDFCQRIKQAGLKVYYLPEAEILHHHGQSAVKTGPKAYQYLVQSSKIYNGFIKYYLLFSIIWLGQRWQKFLSRLKDNKSKDPQS